MKKTLFFFLLIGALFALSSSNEEMLPPHLQAARDLQEHVLPQNNSYRHRPSTVRWKEMSGIYECHTDCSGLVDALLKHSYGYTDSDFERWLRKRRALSSSYFRGISENRGFTRIHHVHDMLPGDLMSYRLPPGSKNFGHVMVVNGLPWPLPEESQPSIPGTRQWAVPIIDCTGKGHGVGDSRTLGDGRFQSGIGKGTFRLYTYPDGTIAGCAWSPSPTAKFYPIQERPFVVGRLIPNYRP